ncbi:MAG: phosphotriesterase family protein [Acidimicrobiales bacterium]
MAQVETVRGPVDTSDLGVTLMHEHVFVLTADVQANLPEPWDVEGRVADAVTQLQGLADIGVRTIVDPTVIGLGRNIPIIQRINEQVDINIVVATGIYTYDSAPFYFRFRFAPAEGNDPMVDLFVHDITEGIVHTGVKAAFLKCAVDEPGLTPDVERILRAVATAHRLTGAPITVHTHPGTRRGLEVAQVLNDEGADPGGVVLGHSGDSSDADHLQALAEMGFLLGMDRFGIGDPSVEEQRAQIVIEMCRRGFSKSMVLSHDTACQLDWADDAALAAVMPHWNYTHIHEHVLPALREGGVTEEQIDDMLVGNPRRYFERASKG